LEWLIYSSLPSGRANRLFQAIFFWHRKPDARYNSKTQHFKNDAEEASGAAYYQEIHLHEHFCHHGDLPSWLCVTDHAFEVETDSQGIYHWHCLGFEEPTRIGSED
jgi:hypothetical protein